MFYKILLNFLELFWAIESLIYEKTNFWDGYAPSVFAELEKSNLLNP